MGGSGGGGGPYYNVGREELRARVKEAKEEISKDFVPGLQSFLDERLAGFNKRDTELIGRRQKTILDSLSELLEGNLDLRMGGSVAKHTYVDGLSDIDNLLVVRDFTVDRSPTEILTTVADRLIKDGAADEVSIGKLAVTAKYKDGMEIQLVPAIRDRDRLRVPSWTREGWSRIDPQAFTAALAKRNQQCGGKLVPVIKLAKAVIANWPDAVQLSGYHVESLAIDAFRAYDGSQTTASMLPYFFERASSSVLSPIKDKTGQSIHVDSYLGKARSAERQKVSHWCSQVAKRMNNASIQGSLAQWRELFEE